MFACFHRLTDAFAGLFLLAGTCRVTLCVSMQQPLDPSPPLSSGAQSGGAKAAGHCSSAVAAFQLHARGVVSDCMLRFYAFVCREHPVEHTKLDFAVNRAEAPDVDDFESFASWSRGQESCSVAVACAVARMLRLLQAAGACPGLRETLQAAAASDRGAAAPLHVLLDGVRAHGPQD